MLLILRFSIGSIDLITFLGVYQPPRFKFFKVVVELLMTNGCMSESNQSYNVLPTDLHKECKNHYHCPQCSKYFVIYKKQNNAFDYITSFYDVTVQLLESCLHIFPVVRSWCVCLSRLSSRTWRSSHRLSFKWVFSFIEIQLSEYFLLYWNGRICEMLWAASSQGSQI